MAQIDRTTPEYKKAAAELNAAIAPLLEGLPAFPYHQTGFVERFLRARELNVTDAKEMLQKCLAWRKEHKIDGILAEEKDEMVNKYHPNGFYGHTKGNLPVRYIRMGRSKLPLLITRIEPQRIERWASRNLESIWKLCADLGTERCFTILDMTDLSLAMCSKPALACLKEMTAIAEANYPESMDKMLIVNANWVFTATWKVAQHFIAAPVREKISIVGEAMPEISKFVDPKLVPTFLGGQAVVEEPWAGDLAYLNDLEQESQEFATIDVAAGKSIHVQSIDAQVGETITWAISTEKHNIEAGLDFDSPSGRRTVKELEKLECERKVTSGTYLVPPGGAGRYWLLLSNEYSRMRGKTVNYKMVAIGAP